MLTLYFSVKFTPASWNPRFLNCRIASHFFVFFFASDWCTYLPVLLK